MHNKKSNNFNKRNHFFVFYVLLVVLLILFSASFLLQNINVNNNWFSNSQSGTSSDDDNKKDDILLRQLYCQYDESISFEKAQGGLKVFIPTTEGYINYNIVHTVFEGFNADVWRLGCAYAYDSNLENEFAITFVGAEWDMALKLNGRDDFIGGYAHGDEKYTSFDMSIDGKRVSIESLQKLTSFTKIKIFVNSVGYDPNDHSTQVLKHYKEYIIDSNGITLNQKVEWLNDFTLGSSYMAMMPPLKTLTDTFYTDVTSNHLSTLNNFGTILNATKAVVYGANLNFQMSIPKYPSLSGGDRFLLTDNGGGSYNKMYFVICNGANVVSGDIWETTTCYQITNS